ncbi:MAG: DnaJ domain-containing protein, partial [Niameybacter sp.]
MKNYYKLLEVNENASQEIISKVFKIHIKLNHPDLFEGEEKLKAEEKMKELNEAYDVLSDETKRKQYDEKLHFEEQQKVQQLNNQELEILKDEVQALRSKIASKEQIIEHFLGGLDLEEYERHASTIQNPSQGVSYTPTETLRSNEDRELEEEHPV